MINYILLILISIFIQELYLFLKIKNQFKLCFKSIKFLLKLLNSKYLKNDNYLEVEKKFFEIIKKIILSSLVITIFFFVIIVIFLISLYFNDFWVFLISYKSAISFVLFSYIYINIREKIK